MMIQTAYRTNPENKANSARIVTMNNPPPGNSAGARVSVEVSEGIHFAPTESQLISHPFRF
ncbi:MAG: hypothetical protein ACJ0BN_04965 [Limisphaerales bacterium]|nr:hypothetical protein [Pedosphaera sp.]HAQ99973.1 hypothetical protein [Verrucomicrobiales bacterium]HBP57146.1 hypothetical protein [Verrucomicrobiales bacterium]HCP38502.1 hypothetical protein [Verrucomicrobiales bacterium]HCZ03168.1 hypothetical protein [Verrucomicrobiales bacterium]|tara:strand:- start:934 stop:1116 length:183 start_codon:yes stop_codon:yes gene_type:complete